MANGSRNDACRLNSTCYTAPSLATTYPLNDPPLITWCLLGHDMTLAKISDQGVIKEMPFLKRLEDQLTKLGPGAFVVLDSLIDIVQMNMIEPMAVNAFFKRLLTGLCQRHRCTILVLAHPSKASMQDGSWVHGSLAMKNAVRNSIAMRKIDGETSDLVEAIKLLADNLAGDLGKKWHQHAYALKAFRAGVAAFLAQYQPQGEEGVRPDTRVVGEPSDPPDVVGRTHARLIMAANAFRGAKREPPTEED